MKLVNVVINDGLNIPFDHCLKKDVAAQAMVRNRPVSIVTIGKKNSISVPNILGNKGPIIQNCRELEGCNGLEWGRAGKVGMERVGKNKTTWGRD